MTPPFEIPLRMSSKRPFEQFTENDRSQLLTLDSQISNSRKQVKPKLSLDADYFGARGQIHELEAQRTILQSKKSMSDFFDDEANVDINAWEKSEDAKSLNEKKSAHQLNAKLFKDQAVKRETNTEEQTQLRHFMQLYTFSPKGLAISDQTAGMDKRDSKFQSEFRQQLIIACNSRHQDPRDERLWCPVLSGWTQQATAAHIFPYEQGHIAMANIFGTTDESNSIKNGLILSTAVEERIAKGHLVLVPNVADRFSDKDVEQWANSEPKSFKIRVLQSDAKGMNLFHPCGEDAQRTWNDLDGRAVNFKSNHRPRTRYLYWQYCQSLLRRSWSAKDKAEKANEESGKKKLWGSRGRYMRTDMLRAFVTEMGHGYEQLLEGAATNTSSDENPMALTAANAAILSNIRRSQDPDDEDDEEDAEENG